MRHLHVLVLIFCVFLGIGPSQAQETGKPNHSGYIYLKDYSLDSKFKALDNQVVKNSFDVIYELNQYDVFFVEEKNKNAGYLKSYQRLSVDMRSQNVEVALKGKKVIINYDGNKPLVDLRLALYELFLGKAYVRKNLAELKKRSEERIARLKKLIEKQEAIAAKKENKMKGQIPDTSENKDKSKGSKSKKSSSGKNLPDKGVDKELNQLNLLQNKKSAEDVSEIDPNQNKAAHEKDKNGKANSDGSKNPSPNLENSRDGKNDIDPAKDAAALSQLDKRYPEGIKSRTNSFSNGDSSKYNAKGSRNSKSVTKFRLSLGYGQVKANNTELVNTTTNLNFINIGGRVYGYLVKHEDDGFWNNLDYEGRIIIGKATSTNGQSVNINRKLDGYIGSPILKNLFGFGGTLTFENIMTGTVVPPYDGIKIADINAFLLGPEIKLRKYYFAHEALLSVGYQMSIFSNSNIKQADYSSSKMYLDLSLLQKKKWGYGFKMEQYSITGSRPIGTSKIKISTAILNLYYQL
jgi:hypothetical protein